MIGGSARRFGVLGPLVFERDGRAVPLASGRQRSVLALLLLTGGAPISRDRLIDELWGERPPASAVSALHVHLSKLRGVLGDLLVSEASGYALRRGMFELDVARFDELVEQARSEPDRAASLLSEALGLFRGEPLCDVAAEGSVAQWRRALEEKRLQAILARLDAQLAAGGAGELLGELEQLSGEHPYEERLWGQLMLALYRAGRQADALQVFDRVRRLFAVELGLEPGERLASLQQRILERDPTLVPRAPASDLGAITAASLPATKARGAWDVPRSLTRLVGREPELAILAGWMADPDVRLVTLTGAGGVGKTRLLMELGRRQETGYLDGAVFVRLERLGDPGLVAAEIASVLAARDGADGPSADGLTSYLAERELLLLIDNFEHLLPASVLLVELLAQASRLRVIVSSRTALRVRGEQVFEVEPLGLPAGDGDREMSQSPAVQLFLQCALAADRKLQIGADMIRSVAGICRALDGLPLAIELAACRSRSLSAGRIAEQLARPLWIGEHGLRDLPARQQTPHATISWSYELLSAGAQALLRSAGVFIGGFTLPALEAVAGVPARSLLDELLDASLVRRLSGEARFELHELVRAFAIDELQKAGAEALARLRHRTYFAAQLNPVSAAFDEGRAPGELAKPLLADHANLRAALEGAIDNGEQQSALSLALGLRPLWIAGMLRHESLELVERLLERLSIPGEKEVALLQVAAFLDSSLDPNAKDWLRRHAARANEIGDQKAIAVATCNLFAAALNTRDRDEMRRLRPGLMALVASDASARTLGLAHYYIAEDAYADGRFESACEHAALSVAKAREAGHAYMLANAVAAQLLAQSARDGVMTHAALAETLELIRPVSHQPLAALALWLVARYAAGANSDTAGRWLAHAERIFAQIDTLLWPESVLRDETMFILEIDDFATLLEQTPPLDHATALAEAAAWLAERDPAEQVPREDTLRFVAASS